MDKIKTFLRNKSVKTSFSIYIIVCIIVAVTISIIISNITQSAQLSMINAYLSGYKINIVRNFFPSNEDYNDAINIEGATNLDVQSINLGDVSDSFTTSETVLYETLGIISVAVYPVCFMLCIWLTSTIFYKRHLKEPLEILDNAADNIIENNLDFTIFYERKDEMGKLCTSFEKMRGVLQSSNFEMWRQVEQRKRLNAAFSHDLRTPLTVLKGQSEMLIKYIPSGKIKEEKILSTIQVMNAHIDRLENYVNVMSKIQKLEDIDINKGEILKDDVITGLRETAKNISGNIKVIFDESLMVKDNFKADIFIVMQVYENLLTNAVRFAKNTIIVTVSNETDFSITVTDDGGGFTKQDLKEATNPFYKASSETDTQHFGMGLNICKILCEKHDGRIVLSNVQDGASVQVVFGID